MNSPPPSAMTRDEAQALHDAPPPPVADAMRTYYRAVRTALDAWLEVSDAAFRRDVNAMKLAQAKHTRCADIENQARLILRRSIFAEFIRERGIV